MEDFSTWVALGIAASGTAATAAYLLFDTKKNKKFYEDQEKRFNFFMKGDSFRKEAAARLQEGIDRVVVGYSAPKSLPERRGLFCSGAYKSPKECTADYLGRVFETFNIWRGKDILVAQDGGLVLNFDLQEAGRREGMEKVAILKKGIFAPEDWVLELPVKTTLLSATYHSAEQYGSRSRRALEARGLKRFEVEVPNILEFHPACCLYKIAA